MALSYFNTFSQKMSYFSAAFLGPLNIKCDSPFSFNHDTQFDGEDFLILYCLGLILYNGQKTEGIDFLAFGLRNRRAELRFDVGSGPAVIVSEPLTLNQWHNVKLKRDRKKGLSINSHNQTNGLK